MKVLDRILQASGIKEHFVDASIRLKPMRGFSGY